MDKYNQHWVLLLAPRGTKNWAVTIGQTTYYSVGEDQVSTPWRRHENTHKQQWAKEGRLKFAFSYLYYIITKGYMNNPYEIEARLPEILNNGI